MPLASLTGWALGAMTIPGTLELVALTAANLLPEKARRRAQRPLGHVVVVVPAHDEEAGVGACVRGLLDCERPEGGFSVLVVADNCTDATADRAREAGAEVLVRRDATRRGKGFALEYAFEQVLLRPEVEAVLVVDADTRVDRLFVRAMAETLAIADAAQCRYVVGNPEASAKARLVAVAFRGFNVIRPRGRARLGLSAGILGNGFGLHRRTLEAVPYTARSVVEDLEYHLMLLEQGFSVAFVDEVTVRADLPTRDDAARTQRARWEGGRFRMLREKAPGLARRALGGDTHAIEPLFELCLLPLATHVGVLGATLLVPSPPTQVYAAAGLGVVAAHVAAAVAIGDEPMEDLRALLGAPRYVVQKAAMLPALLGASGADQAWVRTAREP